MNTERYTRFEGGISNGGELVISFTPSSLDGLTVEQATAAVAAQTWVLYVEWRTAADGRRWLWVEPTADAQATKLDLIRAASMALRQTRKALGVDKRGRKTKVAE